MADGVFYQRLQQQRRHGHLAQGIGQIQRVLQAWAHAHGHQLQVVAQAVKFVGQGVLGGAGCRQGGAQVGNQVVQHGLGAGGV